MVQYCSFANNKQHTGYMKRGLGSHKRNATIQLFYDVSPCGSHLSYETTRTTQHNIRERPNPQGIVSKKFTAALPIQVSENIEN